MPKLTVPQLRKRCKEAGLVTTGNKQELIDRLEAHEFHTVSNTLNVELMQRVSQLEKTLEDLQARADVTDGTLDDFSPPLRSSPQKHVHQNYDLANAVDSPTGYTASIANGAPLTVYASSHVAATTWGAPSTACTSSAVVPTTYGAPSTACVPSAVASNAYGAPLTAYASSAVVPITYGAPLTARVPSAVASSAYGAPLTACAPSAAASTAYVATSTTHGMSVVPPITYGATTSRFGPGVIAPSTYGATTTASGINPPVSMTPQYYASVPNAGVRFANIPTESVWTTNAAPPRSGVYVQNTVPPSNNFVAQHAWPMAPGYMPDLHAMNGPPANPLCVGSSYVHMPTSTIGLKDMVAILPEFDPMNNASLSSTQFVQRVQTMKNAYGWRDDIVIMAVQQKMRGHAKLWVDSLTEVFTSWLQFAEKLTVNFPFNDNAADAHIRMSNTKRNANETPQEYFYKMLALGGKYGMPDNVIARHVINGINESELKRKISNEYMSSVDLLRDIENYCRFNEAHLKNKTHLTAQRYTEKPNTVQMGTEARSAKPLDKNFKCYNCHKYGHISSKCSEPQRVPKCERCQKHHPPSTACRSQINVKAVNAKESKQEITKTVVVNDWTGQAVVDSGSEKTLMRKKVMRNFGPTTTCHVTLNGFGGGQYASTESMKLNMLIDGNAHEVNVLAVNDELLDADILLGRDVLCQEGTRVVIQNEECWIEKVNEATVNAAQVESHERNKLKSILNEYRDCFANDVHELGTCTIKKMEIKLKSDEPINVKPYRIPFAKREEARKIIQELLDANIIEHSESPYASPVVLVPKKDGSLRLCVDFRLLNRNTVKTPFPMPIWHMDEQFAQLAGQKYFTTMDLKMGYHQVEIEESSRKFTGFVTVDGHYQYTRMPFGLVNAPALFQDIMNTLAKKMKPGEVLAYLDDVVIPSRTVDEGLDRLTKFFDILRQAGLTLKLEKCKFLATKINFLGHTITAAGISPGTAKVSAVQNFKVPTNVTEVRRFLGLTGFFRKFIQNYAVVAKPLTKLLHKTEASNFNWGQDQNASFQKLIAMLSEKPVLALYDPNAAHEVHTDASSVGLAGVLLQSEDGHNWKAVFFYSRHCTDAESRYSAYELEVLAVVETVDRFRVYLLGKHFRLVTDCAAIAKMKAQKELIPRIARWFLRLLEYNYELVHRAGTQLAHVDALSRAPNEAAVEADTAGFINRVVIGQDDWLLTMQLQDQHLKHVIMVLQGEIKDDHEQQYRKEYQLKNSRLYRRDDSLKFVVPKAVRWRITKACHDDMGHFGVDKTVARIKSTFWFPRMRNYVKSYIAACVDCCYAKAEGGKKEGQLHLSEVQARPFATLHIDHLGPFVKSSRGMSYVLAMSDAFSKFLVIKPVRTTKTAPVITALLEFTTYFGLPTRIISDRGTAFTSKAFAEFCSSNCIQHIKNAVRTPRANGQVERANQTILASLRAGSTKPRDWDLQLRTIQWAVNSQKNATTGFSPNELIFDFSLRDLTHNQMIAVLQDEELEEDKTQSILEKRQAAAENIAKEREGWKQRFDSRHKTPQIYDEGDIVLIENEPPATGESKKLEPKYKGPYMISKNLGNDRYLITDVPGMQVTQRAFESVYCADKIKRWCSSAPELDDTDELISDEDESIEDDLPSGKAEMSADIDNLAALNKH